MKISPIVFVALVVAEIADAKSSISGKVIQSSIQKIDQKSLLRKSHLVKGRQLAENENNNNNEFQIDGSYTINFDRCISMTMLNEEMLQQGLTVQPSKDYVMFQAVDSYGRSTEFATDIHTFVETLMYAELKDVENYCDACSDAQQYCFSQGNYAQQNNAYQLASNGGGRKLNKNGGTKKVDCDTCASKGCFEGGSYRLQNAINWLSGIGECQVLTNGSSNQQGGEDNNAAYANYFSQYNNQGETTFYEYQLQYPPRGGFICNQDGTGMEIGIFLDEDCTVWDSTRTFKSFLKQGSQAYSYYTLTKNTIEQLFVESVSCKETKYVSPFQQQEEQQGSHDEEEQQQQEEEASNNCQELVQDAANLSYGCGGGDQQNQDNNNNNNQDQSGNRAISGSGQYTYVNQSTGK